MLNFSHDDDDDDDDFFNDEYIHFFDAADFSVANFFVVFSAIFQRSFLSCFDPKQSNCVALKKWRRISSFEFSSFFARAFNFIWEIQDGVLTLVFVEFSVDFADFARLRPYIKFLRNFCSFFSRSRTHEMILNRRRFGCS